MFKFFFIVSNASSATSKGKTWANNQGECADFGCNFASFCSRMDNSGKRDVQANFDHNLTKALTVLSFFNSIQLCANELDSITSKNAFFCKSNGEIEAGLTSEGWQKRLRFFA